MVKIGLLGDQDKERLDLLNTSNVPVTAKMTITPTIPKKRVGGNPKIVEGAGSGATGDAAATCTSTVVEWAITPLLALIVTE